MSEAAAPAAEHDGGESNCGHEHEQFIAILFPFFALALGIFFRHLLKCRIFGLVKVPFTALLLVAGILLGIWTHESDLQELGESFDMWIHISPEVVLYGFLPVLVFASGLNANVHIFFKVFYQCVLLAGPGVALGAFLTATVTKFVFTYKWSWNTAMVIGSILAATDPVAVVALLKDVGASPRLGTVIEGESLLNDGIAIVFFNLFLAYATDSGERNGTSGPSICYGFDKTCINIGNAGGVIRYFAQVVLGGPAIGIAFALGVVVWVNFTTDVIIDISLTLALAYLSFFVADFTAGTSGVLAVVTAGVLVAYLGRPNIVGEDNSALEVFWEMIEFVANTVIFVLAGLIIGYNFLELDDIGGREWGFLVVLYVFLYLIRCTIIILFFPILMRLGYGLNTRDAMVIVHGGLRGAVGLALAILVQEESIRSNRGNGGGQLTASDGNRILFYVGGIAVMTLLLQATTTEPIMRRLGMFVLSKGTLRTQEETKALLHDKAVETYNEACIDQFLGECCPAIVARLVPTLSLSDLVQPATLSRSTSGSSTLEEKGTAHNAGINLEASPSPSSSALHSDSPRKANNNGHFTDHSLAYTKPSDTVYQPTKSDNNSDSNNVIDRYAKNDTGQPKSMLGKLKFTIIESVSFRNGKHLSSSNKKDKFMDRKARRTSILTEKDLEAFDLGSYGMENITLEELRPFLADLEIRYLNGIIAAYKRMREKNLITTRTEVILHQSVDYALDTPEMVNDWEFLRPFCAFKKGDRRTRSRHGAESYRVRSDQSIDSSSTFSTGESDEGEVDMEKNEDDKDDKLISRTKIVSSMISVVNLLSAGLNLHHSFDELYLGVQIASAYLTARNEINLMLEETLDHQVRLGGLEEMERSETESGMHTTNHGVAINKILLKCLKKEMDMYDSEARRYLNAIRRQKPYVLAAVQSEHVAALILHNQSCTLEEMLHEGLLLEKEYLDLLYPIKACNRQLHKGPKVLRDAKRLYVGI